MPWKENNVHNLGTVFAFEVTRTLKKKSFWITAFGFPLVIAAIGAIIYFSNKTTDQATEDTKNQRFSVVITDESSIIQPGIIKQHAIQKAENKQKGHRHGQARFDWCLFFSIRMT